MDRYKLIHPALLLAVWAGAAMAQTPANITVLSGNGQMICQGCNGSVVQTFAPMVAEVTDANGNPVSGATVTWTVTSGGYFGTLVAPVTQTGSNGTTSSLFFPSTAGVGQGLYTPFSQTMITATAGSASANFYLTQVLADGSGNNYISIQEVSPNLAPGSQISGPVGTTSASPLQLAITAQGQPVPNVAVNLWNQQCGSSVNCPSGATVGATAQCAAGAGAGTGTVLTNSTGEATCDPVFGGVPGTTGTFYVLVGAPLQTDPTLTLSQSALDYSSYGGPYTVSVNSAAPTALQLTSGNNQTVLAGQALPLPLTVTLLTNGGVGLAGQTINWTVSPSGAATLGGSSTTTNSSGVATNSLTLSSSASGTVTVTATAAGTTLAPATFTITATPLITATGLSVVGSSSQTLAEGATSAPLTVQLNGSNNQGIPNVPVQWTITSGTGTLSQSSVSTGSNGQASVTLTAGATAGTVTVSASADGYNASFTLTVVPPGPQLTSSSFVNGADFQVGSLSPCSIATIEAAGVAPGLSLVSGEGLLGPLPYTLAGESVTVNGGAAPIFDVGTTLSGQQQLTFQVPCDATPGSSVSVNVNTVGGGHGSATIALEAASPGIFQTVMLDGVSRAVVVRPDGTYVSLTNPARRGETDIAFATGLGPSTPVVGTNSLPVNGVTATPQDRVIVGMAGQGIPSGTIQLSQDLQGVWIVPFTIPASINSTIYPACGSGNCVTFSMSVIPVGSSTPISSGTTTIPVE